eukprot:Polyplicarium_translucidae@DN3272_c0_g1_i5.p1
MKTAAVFFVVLLQLGAHAVDCGLYSYSPGFRNNWCRDYCLGSEWGADAPDFCHSQPCSSRVKANARSFSTASEPNEASCQDSCQARADCAAYLYDGVRHGLAPHDGGAALRCDTMDYPSVETVATALQRMGNGKPVVRFVVPPKRQMEYEELCLLLDGFGIDAQVVFSDSYTSEDQRVAVEAGMDVCVPPRRRSLGSRTVFERLLR